MENAENTQASSGAYDQQHPTTQGFPAYQQAPPADPRWLGAPPTRRRRGPVVLAVILGAVVALVLGFVVGFAVNDDSPNPFARPASDSGDTGQPANTDNGNAAQPEAAAAPGNGVSSGSGGGAGFDLRKGGVFLQSNDATTNEVVAFARDEANGKVREVGRYETGGVGSGSFQDSAQGIVLGTATGEASPTHNVDSAQLLFVVNAGSNSVSVFRVNADGLELASEVPSGGETPVSLTVNSGLVYVLNSGELDDRLLLNNDPTQFIDNCTTGEPPSVSGFRVEGGGKLTPIENSKRLLSGSQSSGCAQVQFTPDGEQLIVTERVATLPGHTPADGAIVTYQVEGDGTLGAKKVQDSSGVGPFGFTFTKDGTLLVTEQNHSEIGKSMASSYTPREDGTLKPISRAVPNPGTDACWIIVTNDGRLAFTSNAFEGGTISSYRVDESGALTLLQGSATAVDGQGPEADHLMDGTTDMALSRDDKYVYQLNSIFGLLQVFQVDHNTGKLSFVEEHKVFDNPTPDKGGQLPPLGLAAF